ncbi:ComEC/Rec2 family competence protein [Enterococcus olivae]
MTIKGEGWKKIWFVAKIILFLSILGGAFVAVRFKDTFTDREEPVDVYFLSTENDANTTLIQQGANTVLIDTGEETDQEMLIHFLKEKQVEQIDYLILTHPDKDHIGGVPEVLKEFSVEHVIMPYYDKEHEELNQLNQQLASLDIPVTYPNRPRNFALGAIRLTIYPPLERHYKKDNNYSLATLLRHEEVNFLFVGDSESKRLQELMQVNWPSINVYLVAHHGRANLSSQSFIEQIKPKITVTTSDSNDQEVQDALEAVPSEMYFTAPGSLHMQSDGESVVVEREKE